MKTESERTPRRLSHDVLQVVAYAVLPVLGSTAITRYWWRGHFTVTAGTLSLSALIWVIAVLGLLILEFAAVIVITVLLGV